MKYIWLSDAHFNGNQVGFAIALIVGVVIIPAAVVWLSSKMNERIR